MKLLLNENQKIEVHTRCKKQVDNCLKSDTSEILALQNNCYKYKDEKLDQFSDYRSIICLSRHKREFLSAFLELSSVVEKSVKLPHQHCCQYRIFAQKHSIYYESKLFILLCSGTIVSFLVAGRYGNMGCGVFKRGVQN